MHGPDYRTWPARLRDPRSAEAEVRRGDLAAQAEFHTWVQWLVASQVAAAQAAARSAGMSIGIIADLAIGAHPGGADAWAGQEFFAQGFTVGAPPDAFNQRGQDWGLPPMHPRALAAAGYRPLADLIDANLSLGGGLRIDHVMGLSRLWWIPAGAPPTEGAYVYYDAPGTLGTLAAAAAATGSVVVGEDLGTVEPWLRDALAARGVLGTQMLWFERGWSGEPPRPAVVAAQLAGHGLHPRPAARRRVPVRVAGDRPARTRPADPLGGRGAGRGRPDGQRLDRRPRQRRACCRAGTAPDGGRVHRGPVRVPGARRPPCSSASTWPRPRARPARRTCQAPATSTRTGSCPSAAPTASPVLLEDLATSDRVRAVARGRRPAREACASASAGIFRGAWPRRFGF